LAAVKDEVNTVSPDLVNFLLGSSCPGFAQTLVGFETTFFLVKDEVFLEAAKGEVPSEAVEDEVTLDAFALVFIVRLSFISVSSQAIFCFPLFTVLDSFCFLAGGETPFAGVFLLLLIGISTGNVSE